MKFKIKTNLWSGIIMGGLSLILLLLMPYQVRVPAFDSGAPSPRIIPGICLVIMLIFSIVLIIQSLVLKKEKIVEFDWQKEKPAILLIGLLCLYVALILLIGFIPASAVTFALILAYCGERKPFIYIFILAASIGIYFLFMKVFNVSLPTGIFF
ncbi:Tripartite tricarboxylate transporter TctB family protein [Pseudobutyrivibrio sp. YE44]|uniref:tripartite tricarboxylate transporter TctB family protein n=1 Tax=Pseudobutyrivibrio sp. YE44 TaxID=1520802 RepID=UPI000891B23C|nr:tripartite tricarboxylate transporter TctB family protein [Pseudobutyrivibrio sp. YE44]SDB53457.1 Tripartite tricarboxylate transporter TctB family protein [Pseudobutyrivibrio sp. YE44]